MAVQKPDFRQHQLFAFALGKHPPTVSGPGQVESRVLHPERVEDTLPQERFKLHTRNDFYDPTKSEYAGLTVLSLAPGSNASGLEANVGTTSDSERAAFGS